MFFVKRLSLFRSVHYRRFHCSCFVLLFICCTSYVIMLYVVPLVLQVWDSIGSVKYRSMAYTFYSAADACVLVFDLNNPASFQHLEDWRTTFLQKTGTQNFPFVVIGNKMDLVQDGERPVSLCCDAVSGEQAEVELNYMLPILLNMR